MPLAVELSGRAYRDLARLPQNASDLILDELRILENPPWPGPPKVKKLKARGLFRLRIGDYRCIFEPWAGAKVVVHRIVGRKDLERTLKSF